MLAPGGLLAARVEPRTAPFKVGEDDDVAIAEPLINSQIKWADNSVDDDDDRLKGRLTNLLTD